MGDSAPATQRRAVEHRSELALRVASTLVLAPLAIGTNYAGGWGFVLFWGAAAAGVFWEWQALVGRIPIRSVAVGLASITVGTVLFGLGFGPEAIIALALGLIAASGLSPGGRRAWMIAGSACADAIILAPLILRSDPQWGFSAVILLFGVVWTTDVAAYFVGRLVGGPKLWPAISPNKTWSGAVGGVVAAVVAGLSIGVFAGFGDLPAVAALSGALSMIAEGGDLAESAVKRRLGAKDAGRLIPGHGGLMDRLDGFVTAAVAGTMIGLLRGGSDAPARGLVIW